eukprot:1616325-Prymnesium_polylepis.1
MAPPTPMTNLVAMNATANEVASLHKRGRKAMSQQVAEEMARPTATIFRTPTRCIWKPTIGAKMQAARLLMAMIKPTTVELRPCAAATSGKKGERNVTSSHWTKMAARQKPRNTPRLARAWRDSVAPARAAP